MVNLPSEFTEKYQNLLGEKRAKALFNSFDLPPVKAFRLNPLKNNFTNVTYSLANKVNYIENGYYGEISGKDVEQLAGYVYSQDPSAMFVAEVADIKPGDKVLDLCAAPGGKTTQLASKMNGEGILVSNEIMPKRAKVLLENIERFGIENILVTNEAPEKLTHYFPNFFNKIIVDAPCSGEGMFRKDHEAIQYWSQKHVERSQALQKKIVDQAYKMLEPGGTLVYSTCTFAPEEDEQIVEYLLEQFDDLEIEPIDIKDDFDAGRPEWSTTNNQLLRHTARFFTDRNFGEGQFVAKLKKEETVNSNPTVYSRENFKIMSTNKLAKSNLNVVNEFIDQTGLDFNYSILSQLAINQEHVFWPIVDPKTISGLHILRNGVEFGEIKKNRFLPHQHLAQIKQKKSAQVYELTSQDDFEKFAHGETIKVSSSLRGYVLVSYKNKVFSWGKIGHDQILKNFYPKGLRLH